MKSYEELVTEARECIDGYIEFEGMDCFDWDLYCEGWDGHSSRCQCGNRRVDWELVNNGTQVIAVTY